MLALMNPCLEKGALLSIKSFRPNIIIIGTSGLRCEEGMFCHGSEESEVKTLFWTKPTDIRLIATDWTKVGKRDVHSFGPAEQLSTNAKQAIVVTNEPPEIAYKNELERVIEFKNQIRNMEKHNIKIDLVPLHDTPGQSKQVTSKSIKAIKKQK